MRLLTHARDLSRRKARDRDGLCVVEGVRAVEEAHGAGAEIVGILAAPQLMETERGSRLRDAVAAAGLDVAMVTEREFASAASTDSPQGVLALVRVPERDLDALQGRATLRLLILDAVQDPGNVGTLIRTAHALGADATLALPGTVDVWNAKVVRSAVGSLFHHHVQSTTLEALTELARAVGCELWAADPLGEPLGRRGAPGKLGLVVGNEGAGLSSAVRDVVTYGISLPMVATAESLNVAVAAGIILYGLRL